METGGGIDMVQQIRTIFHSIGLTHKAAQLDCISLFQSPQDFACSSLGSDINTCDSPYI